MKIGLFDSGIGGTTTMAEIKKILPEAEYVFIADSENCPYGEKTDEELWKIVCHNVDELLSQKVDLIVIACNTATTRCTARLREAYPDVIFVGTEPAIKAACDIGAKKILVMATPGTVASERTHMLVEENQRAGQEIQLLGCKGLADAVESGDEKRIDQALDDCLKDVKGVDFDVIVLGCTHYPLIRDKIQSRFPNSELVDGNIGVAKRVAGLLR